MVELAFQWIATHGSGVIFGLFAFGIIGVPIPGELMLAYLGYLISNGNLRPVPAVASAYLGVICGMVFNYVLGRTAGFYLVRKFGRAIRLSEEKLLRMHDWFEHKGKWILFFGYFLPAVRHVTAFAAGTSKMTFNEFIFFSASGALIWTGFFIGLGFSLEDEWSQGTARIHHVLEIASAIVVVLGAGFLLWKKRRRKRRQ